MQVTVTGATGLLGANLAIELLRQGYAVRGTRRSTSRTGHLKAYPIEWFQADIDDTDALANAFSGSELVFHCAAKTGGSRRVTEALAQANVEGTRSVLEAVRRCGVSRLVHCSTIAACAVSEDGRPVTEDAPHWNLDRFGMADGYALTKRKSQELVLEAVRAGLDAVVVNPAYMLGPLDSGPGSGRLVLDVIYRRIPGYTAGRNNFVDVRDVSRGMILAAERGRRGECYILGGENLSYRDLFDRITRIAGVPPIRRPMPKVFAVMAGWYGDQKERLTGREVLMNSVGVAWAYQRGTLYSSEKAKSELGYRSGSIDRALADAIAWFQQQEMLKYA